MEIRLDVAGDELLQEIADLRDRAQNLAPMFVDAAEAFYGLMGSMFATQGAAGGRRWPALTADTRAWKQDRVGSQPVGVFTGVLAGSLTSAGGTYASRQVRGDRMVLATRAPHAGLFSDGRGGQQARPLEPTVQALEGVWGPIVAQHFGDRAVFTGVV